MTPDTLRVCELAQEQWDSPTGCQALLDHWAVSAPKAEAERLIGELAATVHPVTVADLGCGPGRLIPHLGDFQSYAGYDTCVALLDTARATYAEDHRCAFHVRDLRAGAPDGPPTYDLALSIDTSRHYYDPLGFLTHIIAAWPARAYLVSVLVGPFEQELMNGHVVTCAQLDEWLAAYRQLARAEQPGEPLSVVYLLLAAPEAAA